MVRSSGCPDAQAPGCWSATQNAEECDGARLPSKKGRWGRNAGLMEGTLEGSFSMAKHLVESEFEVIPSDGAVEVIFIPTRSHYTFSGCPIGVTSLNSGSCR